MHILHAHKNKFDHAYPLVMHNDSQTLIQPLHKQISMQTLRNLKFTITQKAIDGFFKGPFFVHMGVVFEKCALPTLLQFIKVL